MEIDDRDDFDFDAWEEQDYWNRRAIDEAEMLREIEEEEEMARKNLLQRLASATGQNATLCREGADEIKRLRKEIERLNQVIADGNPEKPERSDE